MEKCPTRIKGVCSDSPNIGFRHAVGVTLPQKKQRLKFVSDNFTVSPFFDMSKPVVVRIISDLVCPWCFVGKRNLEKAVMESKVPGNLRCF